MERLRVPYERERWLSAVLIVTAIAGVSLAVSRWPLAARPAPRAVHLLPARALPLFDPPGVLVPMPPPTARTVRRAVAVPPLGEAAPAVAVAAPPESDSSSDMVTVPVTREAGAHAVDEPPPLVSRRVELAGSWPSPQDPETLDSSPLPLAIVQIPVVAVTRAVLVAGRGIRTGLRATGAMVRAAF